jgi:hypothetical protein
VWAYNLSMSVLKSVFLEWFLRLFRGSLKFIQCWLSGLRRFLGLFFVGVSI